LESELNAKRRRVVETGVELEYEQAWVDSNAAEDSIRRRRRRGMSARDAYWKSVYELGTSLFRAAKQQQQQKSSTLMEESLEHLLKYIGQSGMDSWECADHMMMLALLFLERYDDLVAFCKYFPRERVDLVRAAPSSQVGILSFRYRGRLVPKGCAYIQREDRARLFAAENCVILFCGTLTSEASYTSRAAADFVKFLFSTRQGQILEPLGPVTSLLEEMALGTKEFRGFQEDQIRKLMDAVQSENPLILLALCESIFLSQDSNAFHLLADCRDEFEGTPGAVQVVAGHYGE